MLTGLRNQRYSTYPVLLEETSQIELNPIDLKITNKRPRSERISIIPMGLELYIYGFGNYDFMSSFLTFKPYGIQEFNVITCRLKNSIHFN